MNGLLKLYGLRGFFFRSRLLLIFAGSLLIALQCGCQEICSKHRRSSKESINQPSFFEVEINSPFHDSFSIKMNGGNLYYRQASSMFDIRNAKNKRVPVTEQKWNLFFERLNEINFWNWKSSYVDASLADGVNWMVNIRYSNDDGKAKHCSGSNAFPPEYEEFLKALRDLMGNKYKIY
jgi:hypothetical protein